MFRLLCLALAACALSAGGAPVAAVGNRTFDTIADALKEDGGLIVLLSDVSGSLPVNVKTAFWGGPENPVTLDLAGHTITGTDASKPVLENNGDLTIIDSVGGGEICDCIASSGGAIKIELGTHSISGGRFSGSIAFNRGTFNLTGGLYDDVAVQGTAVTRHISKGYEIVANDDPQTATSYGWKIAKIEPPPDPPPQPPPEQPEEKGHGFLLILR